MNKYIRQVYCVPIGIIKTVWTKIFNFDNFKCNFISSMSPLSELTLDGNGKLSYGKMLKMRDGSKIRVRSNASCVIGDYCSLSSNSIITCRDKIELGNYVWLSPNVQIYDHDHDYKANNGIKESKYKTSPIKIGNNVWLGANVVILKGTTIGDNSVIGAGCVLKGDYPENSVIVQKRESVNINKYE